MNFLDGYIQLQNEIVGADAYTIFTYTIIIAIITGISIGLFKRALWWIW